MANKMLIDATHPEETRVVVVRGNRVEEFDFESASRKQLRGNIYLAKVTRVEPSLQAAFVEYGGNRHGFLAFSEIHPDYYQIPVADRQALIEAEEQEEREAEERAARQAARRSQKNRPAAQPVERISSEPAEGGAETAPAVPSEAGSAEVSAEQTGEAPETAAPVEAGEATEGEAEAVEDNGPPDDSADSFSHLEAPPSDHSVEEIGHDEEEEENPEDSVESVGAEDALEELPERRRARARQYKIQEVIKRRQVLLVQVVKEERGNKGAALTTYLSLAGRYSVLMPNTARGGGISRKITNTADRKRLKEVAQDLDVPEGMGVILRTAGATRTKAEVKRDFEYLLRLWENVRELTLRSSAPTLVYEEGSLIKRSIRDLYNKDIDEVLVAGEEGYREAKDFMRMLMPSHAKNVQPYRETQPIFARYSVEAQLDAMFSPQVTLKSGGYLVINQTEALVAIDVNSGRSTREHNIEDTAYQTNLEAAEEVARQLRLRDLAGLIVIDFIDMEEKRNNRAVENKLKAALKNDRARIQVGRISHFGLMEMSRQRIRTGVVESSMEVCPHCHGTGHVRAPASVALHVLRSVEDTLLKGATHDLIIRTRTAVALYILNQKRGHLAEIEERFGISITVLADDGVTSAAHYTLERGEPVTPRETPLAPVARAIVQPDSIEPVDEEIEDEVEADEEETETERPASESQDEGGARRKRRRRRRRRGGEGSRDGHDEAGNGEEVREAAESGEAVEAAESEEAGEEGDDEAGDGSARPDGDGENGEHKRRRRRGRRGGRRGRREDGTVDTEAGAETDAVAEGDGEPSVIEEASAEEGEARLQLDETGEVLSSGFVEDEPEGIRDIDPEDAGERLVARDVPIADMAEYEAPLLDPIEDEAELDMPEMGDDEDDEPEDETSDLRVIDEDAIEAAEGPQEPDESVVADEPPSDPVSDTVEEDNRPKRVGWWRRRSS
ncbi:ribonuclease E/G [Kaistia geumhonensis]|uniref:Ribonuclease E n=1 Tax=Kaistia geumhonensis TaxID=410839 RepID=A0ABU0M2B4_9HYPH|nr:ribonuclease E/G [Kaistia geumhonensis]MCX5479701.1 ribonuclease E/G [Kaistia geumhonensis]MDQ0515075.1 ribonuclease E [Kaistia geumhonensis]